MTEETGISARLENLKEERQGKRTSRPLTAEERQNGLAPQQPAISREQARAVLEAEEKRNLEEAGREIQAILDRRGLVLDAVAGLTADGRIGAQLQLRPKGDG